MFLQQINPGLMRLPSCWFDCAAGLYIHLTFRAFYIDIVYRSIIDGPSLDISYRSTDT